MAVRGENREFSLVEMIIRLVMAIFFIGISQPAWGFAIDVTNAVTIGMLDYDPTVGGGPSVPTSQLVI